MKRIRGWMDKNRVFGHFNMGTNLAGSGFLPCFVCDGMITSGRVIGEKGECGVGDASAG